MNTHATRAGPAPITIGGREFRWGERTYVMGVVNVTPDSFSGDGLGDDVAAAVRQAVQMREGGADIIDVGGESTRPGFAEVPADEEMRRVLPVIERLARELDIPISIDTNKRAVAKAALEAGASLVNDVHGFLRDPGIARVAAEAGVPAIAMYNHRGREFHDTIGNVVEGLTESLKIAREQGLPEDRIIVDPGFNFGWTDDQALEMLRRLAELRVLGRPILIGTSRKSTIGNVLGGLPVEDRVEGTAATMAIAIANGADIIRVHDVIQMVRVARMADAVVRGVATWNRLTVTDEWQQIHVPFVELVGARVEEAQEGYSRLSLVLEERHTNPNGVMHGGVVATVMDSAAAVALGRLRGEKMRRDKPHATVDMNVALISAARPGDELVIEGRVLKLRRSVAFVEAEARRVSDGELVAKGRFTFAISNRDG